MAARSTLGLSLVVTLLVVACSRQTQSGATNTARAVGPARTSGPLCKPAAKDLQSVRLDVDEKFLAGHGATDILDPVWWSGDIYGSVIDYDRCLAPFTREQRLLYAVLWYQSEVNNGGHDQFFFNSTGIVYPDAVSGLRELDLTEGVEILTEAGRRMGGSPARDRTERQRQLDKLHPEFGDLDARFYELEKKVNLDAAMTTYMRAHTDAFAFHGVVQIPRSTLELRKRFAAPQ